MTKNNKNKSKESRKYTKSEMKYMEKAAEKFMDALEELLWLISEKETIDQAMVKEGIFKVLADGQTTGKSQKQMIDYKSDIIKYTKEYDPFIFDFIEACKADGIMFCKKEEVCESEDEMYKPILARELNKILYDTFGLFGSGIHIDKNGELDEKSKIRLREIVEKMKQEKLKQRDE